MKKNILIIFGLMSLSACTTTPNKNTPPPVSTVGIIVKLQDQKKSLKSVGDSADKISISLDKSLSINQQLGQIVTQLQEQSNNKK